MKIIKTASLLVVVLLAAGIVFGQDSSRAFVPGELLVKFKDGTASEAARTSHRLTGASIKEEFPTIGWQRSALPKGLSVERAINKYGSFDGVENVQPNYYYHLLATPNDPDFTHTAMYGLGKISAPSAWDLSTGSSNVVVVDIDTGMWYTHQDLAANAWVNTGEVAGNGIDDDGNGFIDDVRGWDFFHNDSNPIDDNPSTSRHGTHTAGTIGAAGNNGVGVVGVNWNVKILPLKIYSSTGSGTNSTSAMLVNAYNYVTMMKNRGVNIRVTNNSYGGCGEACGYDQATKDALDAMGDAGILNVFAAGNSSTNNDTTPFYPASYTSPSIVSVAASTSTDSRIFSWGLNSVDLAAPGSQIRSTLGGTDSSYGQLSGTSMAAPHVTGAAALLSAFNPNLSAASLKASLLNNVDVLPAWNGFVKSGGRLNVFKAMQTPTVCSFQLSQNQASFPVAGGSGSVNVTAATNCDYAVKSNASWITINTGNPGSGNGSFSYTVGAMPIPLTAGWGRTGTITVGGVTFTVEQEGIAPPPSQGPLFDFDGDGRSDRVAIENVSNQMMWHNLRSASGYAATPFGLFTGDVPISGDFDGDGRTDITVWRNSTGDFYYLESSTSSFKAIHFGATGDNPKIVQDFDFDGKDDFAVTRKAGGFTYWYILGSEDGFMGYQYGLDTDLPLRGDFDGDGKADLAVYRPAPANAFYIVKSGNGSFTAVTFGLSDIDTPVAADFDGDNKTDIAVWRSTDGYWYYLRSSDGVFAGFPFGMTGDLPTPADYDGDGRTDFSVWRPNASPGESGIFYTFSMNSGLSATPWGNSTMKIPANSFQTP